MRLVRSTLLGFFLFLSALCLSAQESVEHKVKWYEDAQSICNRHGISMDELLKANSLHYSTDIKAGMTIIIPARNVVTKPDAEATDSRSAGKAAGASAALPAAGAATAASVALAASGASSRPADSLTLSAVDSIALADSSYVKRHLRAGLALENAMTGAAREIASMYGPDSMMGREAARIARPGETVILSPASASFDHFKNFEERGRHFKDLVRAL